MDFSLATIDAVIVIGYLIFVILLGFYFSQKHEDAEDYFLAGRSLTWPLIGFSLFASNMSSNSLVGLAGAGYKDGYSVYSYEWMAVIILIIFAVFFLPFYLKNKIFTIPEYLENRFSYPVRAYASGIAIILNVLVDVSATLYAGGIVINLIFPEIPLQYIVIGVAIIAGIYTIAGGLSAVVYTDAVQAVILIFGSTLITIFAYNKVGGWDAVYQITDPSHFDIIKPVGDEALPWPGLFTGVLLIGFYFWGTNQYITQRTLAAKSVREGQWGSMFAGFLKLSILFIMVFPGALARVLYPDILPEDTDQIYPMMLFDLLPTGILGFVLAGLIAAMMSSLDSGMNSVSTLFTMDFYKKWKPNTSPEGLMKQGRIVTVFIMVIAIFVAPQIGKFDGLWGYLQQTLAWFSPPVVALFVGGLFFKRSNTQGAYACIGIGLVLTVALIINSINGGQLFSEPHFLYMAGIHFALSFGALLITSYTTAPPPQHAVDTMVWTPAVFAEETESLRELPWYKNYRFQGIALCVVVAIILIVY